MRGLSASEVAERSRRQDHDAAVPTSRPLIHIIRDNVLTLFNGILAACFAVIVALGDLRDGLFFGVVVANSAIGVIQEVRAKRALDRLAILSAPTATVVRDGLSTSLPSARLVEGDLLVLSAGDQVTADAELIETTDLLLDESLLTGESHPVAKAVGDTVNSGTLVVRGTGYATVRAVGSDSYAGRLTAEIRRYSLARSELRAATRRILVYISWIVGPVAVIVIVSKIIAYRGAGPELWWRSAALDLVASVVSIIPEGLVLLVSLAFGVAAIRLAQRNVIVQELAAVEILARVDVLCLDKTGTLTEPTISFVRCEILDDHADLAEALAQLAAGDHRNATGLALSVAYPHSSADRLIDRLPFASERAFSAVTLGARSLSGSSHRPRTWVLGAPERLLVSGSVARERAARLAAEGHRVVALTRVDSVVEPLESLVPLEVEATPAALVIFGETIRSDAAETIAYLAAQGIRPVILSGDNPATVAGVASRVGIAGPSIDAGSLDSADAIDDALADASVFGRVTPDQKRLFVQSLQRSGHCVAMTGDGVNDAMAIKDADLGIAMGSGTSATRAVARLVLLDDGFAQLPRLLAYGRQVIANVERVAHLFLAKTVYGIVFAVVFAALLWQFPFLPRQLTLISTLTIGIPAFLIALLPNTARYRAGIVARLVRYALPTGAIMAAVGIGVTATLRSGIGVDQTRAVATVAVWIVSWWFLCTVCRPMDRVRLALVASMAALFLVVVGIPGLRTFFAMDLRLGLPLAAGVAFGIVGAIAVEVLSHWAHARGLLSRHAS